MSGWSAPPMLSCVRTWLMGVRAEPPLRSPHHPRGTHGRAREPVEPIEPGRSWDAVTTLQPWHAWDAGLAPLTWRRRTV